MAKAESLRIPAPKVLTYDLDEANRLVNEAFQSQGWLVTDISGDTFHDTDKLRHAMYMAFTTDHVVTTMASGTNRRTFDRLVSEAAVTKYGLYIELFPNGPGAVSGPVTEEAQAAKDHISTYVWKQCTPTNRSAWLQRELADSNLVVLETRVMPTDPAMSPQPGRYVTNVEHAMLQFLEEKVLEDVRKKIHEADEWIATFTRRNPDIALPAARKAKAALKAAVDAAVHANPAYVRESLALTTGDTEDIEDTTDSDI